MYSLFWMKLWIGFNWFRARTWIKIGWRLLLFRIYSFLYTRQILYWMTPSLKIYITLVKTKSSPFSDFHLISTTYSPSTQYEHDLIFINLRQQDYSINKNKIKFRRWKNDEKSTNDVKISLIYWYCYLAPQQHEHNSIYQMRCYSEMVLI